MADEKTKVNPAQTTDGGGKDTTKPTDTDAGNSAGANNPAQPAALQGTGAGVPNSGADLQGGQSREGQNAAANGAPPAAATVGQTVTPTTPGRMPSEDAGYSAIPADETGDADSDGIGMTQAVQRLQRPDQAHEMSNALGKVQNIPPGSRPVMIDPMTGLGVTPPQTQKPEDNSDDGVHS